LIVILCLFSVNGEAQTEATRVTSTAAKVVPVRTTSTITKKPCCDSGCLTCDKCGRPDKKKKLTDNVFLKEYQDVLKKKDVVKKQQNVLEIIVKHQDKFVNLLEKRKKQFV